MKKFLGSLVLLVIAVFLTYAQEDLPAFPGAEGFGKYTTGGRGGQVYYVTTLEDNNSVGSLRYALSKSGPRIILFKVAGTIRLKSGLSISRGDVTIAGQTAPGDGITIRDYPVTVNADNVIIRFMRFRMGDVTAQEADALGGVRHKNIMVDHCSMSWSTDECASFYDNDNFTLQWSILSESLRISVHAKGTHGYGGIWGGRGASFHHNLLAHHDSRNPRFCGSRYSNRSPEELVDFRNNVIFNWGANSGYAGEGGRYNMINNYYKYGPATKSSVRSRIFQPYPDDGTNSQPAGIYGTFYVDGNYVTASSAVTSDNWQGISLSSNFATYAPGVTKDNLKSDTEFEAGELTTHSAEKAYEKVVVYAGASLKEDSIDMRIKHEVSSGTITYNNGGNGSTNGLIDTQGAVGGWPILQTGEAPADTDGDGMPDNWELANGLLPNDPGDAQLKSVDGVYPNIEVYINALVADIVSAQNQEGITMAAEKRIVNNSEPKIYFNGLERILVVNHAAVVKQISVYDISGKLLLQKNVQQSTANIPVHEIQSGVYILRIVDAKHEVFAKKIVLF